MASLVNFTEPITVLFKFFQKTEEEETSPHFMRQALPWDQSQTGTLQVKEITNQYSWWTLMQKSSTKDYQIEPKNTLKESFTTTKGGLFQGCKHASIYTNPRGPQTRWSPRWRNSIWQNSTSFHDMIKPSTN